MADKADMADNREKQLFCRPGRHGRQGRQFMADKADNRENGYFVGLADNVQ